MSGYTIPFRYSLFLTASELDIHWLNVWTLCLSLCFLYVHDVVWQPDMSTARQRLKSPQSLSSTSAHLTMVTLVNIMVMNGWLTSFSFHVNQPSHSWDKAISGSDLEISTPRSRSCCGQRARSYNRPSMILTHLVFISHQSDQQFLR